MTTECPHGDDATICPPCQRAPTMPRSDPARLFEQPTTIQARYDGTCTSCSSSIIIGDWIYLVDDDWVCERCAG